MTPAATMASSAKAAAALALAVCWRREHRRRGAGLLLRRRCNAGVSSPACSSSLADACNDPVSLDLVTEKGQMSLIELEEAMQAAVKAEDFKKAATIRDFLQARKFEGEMGILSANQEFFAAFKARDIERMSNLWHSGDHSCCIHQAKRPVHGHQAVMESWTRAFRERKRRNADYTTQSVVIRDNIGRIVVTSEKANSVITNFFERTPQGWRMWCHQEGAIEPVKQAPVIATLARSIPKWCAKAFRAVKDRVQQKPQLQQARVQLQRQMQPLSR